MKNFTSFLVLSIILFACHRKMNVASEVGSEIPVCIMAKIDSIQKLPVWNPPATVDKYEYEGKAVYVFSADCCDFFTMAYDENCNYICAPSGGFTGRGDGLCKDFNEKAKLIKQVWKDGRARN